MNSMDEIIPRLTSHPHTQQKQQQQQQMGIDVKKYTLSTNYCHYWAIWLIVTTAVQLKVVLYNSWFIANHKGSNP